MGVKITELYNADTSAGDLTRLTGNEIIPFDADPATVPVESKGITLTQLKNYVRPEEAGGVLEFRMYTEIDSLIATISTLSGIQYSHYALLVDNTATPAIGDPEFVYGAVPKLYNLPDTSVREYYLWVHDGATVTKILPSAGNDNGQGGINLPTQSLRFLAIDV